MEEAEISIYDLFPRCFMKCIFMIYFQDVLWARKEVVEELGAFPSAPVPQPELFIVIEHKFSC